MLIAPTDENGIKSHLHFTIIIIYCFNTAFNPPQKCWFKLTHKLNQFCFQFLMYKSVSSFDVVMIRGDVINTHLCCVLCQSLINLQPAMLVISLSIIDEYKLLLTLWKYRFSRCFWVMSPWEVWQSTTTIPFCIAKQ